MTPLKTAPYYDHANDDVLIHVRYWPNSDIMNIDRLPQGVSAQNWHDLLVMDDDAHYQTFAGGRGFFRLPRRVYDNLSAQATQIAAE
jgi:hypothetical protein